MLYRISKAISDQFETYDIISKEDKELYSYGVRQGLIIFLNLLTVSFIGWGLGMFVQCSVYMAAYSVLRIFAGGYHARTPVRCYFVFIIMATSMLLVIKFLTPGIIICCLILSIGGTIIFILAPVEDSNKPLDRIERYVYRRRMCIVLLIELLAFFLALIIDSEIIYATIALACGSLSVLVFVGHIKNKIYAQKHEKQFDELYARYFD